MIKFIYTAVLAIFFTQGILAQESDQNPVDQEFTNLIESSNNYQGYKVVDYEALVRLKESTNRHIANLESEINAQQKTIDEQGSEIEELKSNLQSTQENLDNVNAEKDSINFLGMPFSKGGYMMLMWGIVALLVLALLFFIYRYKNSNATTREARKRLDETEKEFDAYRTKALEKEQKLGRMLQDERNKSNT
ncbi:hypothetical protein ACW6QP_13735 [Salegentibacter sp. HM20]